MKSKMITLGIMLFTALNAYPSGNIFSNEGSIEKTYIKNNKRTPDPAYQAELRQMPAWRNFLQKHSTWHVEFNEENSMPHRAYGKPISAVGSDPGSMALNFISSELADFNIPIDDLYFMGAYSTPKHIFVNFYQVHKGLKVLNSRLTVKMTHEGGIILFGADVYNDINVKLTPGISESNIITFAQQGISETIISETANPGLFILPVPGDKKNQYKLVYEVIIETSDAYEIPARYYTLVDAASGEVLYRQNMIKHSKKHSPPPASLANVEVNMEASLYTTQPYNPATVEPLANMRININATNYNTDNIGYLLTGITSPTTGTFYLDGLWADVETNNVTPSFTASLIAGPNTVSFNTNANIRERTAYYHVNIVHDYMKSVLPSFTGMDFPLTTNVDVTGTCNAFYSGSSINFYAAGGGCNSFATVGDVVYHEYGHGINDNFYSSLGGSFQNGAMGEGYSDVWAFAITLNPILGLGNSSTDPNDFIRRYDINPKVYPIDIVGEVHADGEIIAGAWWDTYLNLGSNMNFTMQLFAEAYPGLQAQTPDGNEGQAFRDVLLDVLQADDNDGNLTNGTPNGAAICSAFGVHGITLISNASITHTPVEQAAANLPVAINVTLNISDTTYLGDVLLFYKLNTNPLWNTLVMTKSGGFNYTANIPAQPVGMLISYYLGVEDNICGNLSSVIPVGAADTDPNLPYYILIDYDLKATEDFDFSIGNWTYGFLPGDNATTGRWELTIPMGSYGTPGDPSTIVAPNYQHTPGGQFCPVTQNASSPSAGIGESDVDGGHTTLQSPVFNLANFSNPVFTYFRWYINNPPTGANPGAD